MANPPAAEAGPTPPTELDSGLRKLISETNGIALSDTLELAAHSLLFQERPECLRAVVEFRKLLFDHHRGAAGTEALLEHQVAGALFEIFRSFPKPYQEEHIHLTGSLTAEFVYPRLMQLLEGPGAEAYKRKIVAVYGPEAFPITCEDDVDRLKITKLLMVVTGETRRPYLSGLLWSLRR